jgi:D-3-phosphoglycerate dehydrogenase
MAKTIVATHIDEKAAAEIRDIFKGTGIDVDFAKNPGEVKDLSQYDAMIVRSDKVDQAVIDAFKNGCKDEKVIIRAGSGVNTIDVEYATRKNIFVENTPGENSNAVAELVFLHMLNAYRHGIMADMTTKEGKFEKKAFMGTELKGKELGIVGFGNIGRLVAEKAAGFGMTVKASDPFVDDQKFAEYNVKKATLEECLHADIVTLHVELNKATTGMIRYEIMAPKMDAQGKEIPGTGLKDNTLLVNAARAKVVNEDDLIRIMGEKPKVRYCADEFHEGDVDGIKRILAAFKAKDDNAELEQAMAKVKGILSTATNAEAYQEVLKIVNEYVLGAKLKQKERVLATPHLGASTLEANVNACKTAAIQAKEFILNHNPVNAVNYPNLTETGRMYAKAGKIMGLFAGGLYLGSIKEIEVTYEGKIPDKKAITASIIAGILGNNEAVSTMNALLLATKDYGIKVKVTEKESHELYENSMAVNITTDQGKTEVEAAMFHDQTRLVNIDGVEMEYNPQGYNLVIKHDNVPGVIGKLGTVLGERRINIGAMINQATNGTALSLVKLDTPLDDMLAKELHQSLMANGIGVKYLKTIDIK